MGVNDKLFDKQDIYGAEEGPVFLSGIQALVRLPMVQRRLDRSQGLNTAGLVSGYRGSPLGAYDQQLWKAAAQLKAHDVVFQPGLNEDLAATSLWGAQMHRAFGPTKVDGVFGIWYGKGPGVDRTGDVFRSANVMGTSRLGGVLAVSGDDHAAQSSMYPHQTDGLFQAVSMPVLQPASVSEVLEMGLVGIALSRYSGLWVGMKTIAEVVEAAGVVQLNPPQTFVMPEHEIEDALLNWDPALKWPGQRFELERRLIDLRLPAARRWARANKLDKVIVAARERRLGVVTVGKAHQDLMQACSDLGLATADLQSLGISIYKVAMSWPLETHGILEFAKGQQELLIVEEKRGTVEMQIKEALYHAPSDSRPIVTGKLDAQGRMLLPETAEFTPILVARALVGRLSDSVDLTQRLIRMESRLQPVAEAVVPARTPYFCSGCPHNTSTKTPDGSISGGGIGCHVMALMLPELKTDTFCQMGGEGIQWAGAQPFSETRHIFQNLGDGTYQHSGLLAIRSAIALGTNITYKILYNDAVAMTGGQPAEGTNDPARITRQIHAEGITTIALVSDAPDRWRESKDLAPGVTVHHRDEMDAVQRRLRDIEGVTAIVYEQTCAAEKRRRRKKDKTQAAATKRVMINPRVCEGCGDCSVQSNCISIEPLETPFGRKRTINQSSCNTDFSCVKGFCPSFVEIEGAGLAKPRAFSADLERHLIAALSRVPPAPLRAGSFNVLLAGVGGTGVLTVGALLGAAALVDRKVSNVLDFTGIAQKNGAVLSQVRISADAGDVQLVRIGPGEADLLIGADLVVSASLDVGARLSSTRSAAVVNSDLTPTSAVVRDRDATLPSDGMTQRVRERCNPGAYHSLNASALTRALFGDSTSAHVLMLGFAWQMGLVPLSIEALELAVDSGVAPALNRRALAWGRIAAANPQAARDAISTIVGDAPRDPETLDEITDKYALELTKYQNEAYARQYVQLVNRVRNFECTVVPESHELARAVARNAFRLMAYKDEYEVARLYASDEFKVSIGTQFAAGGKISVWLAPPLISRIDPLTGRPKKIKFGPWIFRAFAVLAPFKALRGSVLDPFARNPERVAERQLIEDYFALVETTVAELRTANHAKAVELVSLVSEIRGFGPVKMKALDDYAKRKERVLTEFRAQRKIPIAQAA